MMSRKSLFFLYLSIAIFLNSCRNQQEVDYPEIELLPDQSVHDVLIAYRLQDTHPLIDKFRDTSDGLLSEQGNGRVSEDILQDFGIDWDHILRIENDSMDVEVYSVQVNDESRPFDVLNLVYFYRGEQIVNTFLMGFTADSVLVSKLLSGEVSSWVDYVDIFTGRLSFYDVESGDRLVSWDLSEAAVSGGRCPCSGGLYDPRCCQGRRKTRRTRIYSDSGGSGGISGYSGGYGGFSAGVALSTSMSFVGIPSYGGGYAFSGGGGISGVVGRVNYPVAVPQITTEEFLRSVEIFRFEESIELDSSFEDNPCVKSVYDELADGDVLYDILKNFRTGLVPDNTPEGDVIFEIRSINGSGDLYGITSEADGNGLITITLNSLYFSNENVSSQPRLLIALTILHESVHAEIQRMCYLTDGCDQETLLYSSFEDLYDAFETSFDNGGEIDHQYIAGNYLNSIATGLSIFDNNRRSSGFYTHLAWLGLANTFYARQYKENNPDEAEEIEATLNGFLNNNRLDPKCD